MEILVGYSGFVGSNLALKHKFDFYFNSKDIKEAYGLCPDLLVYAGVPGTKWLANKYPDADKNIIKNAIENIQKIIPKKLILISTIDIYDVLDGVDEDYSPDILKLHPYGFHRYFLEQEILNRYDNVQIFRLPAIYGLNLKKNFIYDLIHITPPVLTTDFYHKMVSQNANLESWYAYNSTNNFYQIKNMDKNTAWNVRSWFAANEFNALSFTNPQNSYQFYNLGDLWTDICNFKHSEERIFNLVTEPIFAWEIINELNITNATVRADALKINYNLYTKHSVDSTTYLNDKMHIKHDLYTFIENAIHRLHP